MKLLWTVVLLLLLPLTMAPRTATEPTPVEGHKVELARPPGSVNPRAGVPLHVTLTAVEPDLDGVLVISATMAGEVRWVSTSAGCRVSGGAMRCPYDLDEGERVRFRATVRPMVAGDLQIKVSTSEGTLLAADTIRVARGRG